MRSTVLLTIATLLLIPIAVDAAKNWHFAYRPAVAKYAIYGGELGDEVAPTSNNKKISIFLDGTAARDVFEQIGPDLTDVCGANSDNRIREKDDGAISCSFSRRDGYRCYFGFDLKSGKSIGGVTC